MPEQNTWKRWEKTKTFANSLYRSVFVQMCIIKFYYIIRNSVIPLLLSEIEMQAALGCRRRRAVADAIQ